MLFAVSMMNIFGVSGNLVSLGAIDFGLIVDGAVIIVEAIVHRITGKSLLFSKDKPMLTQAEMDKEVYTAASKNPRYCYVRRNYHPHCLSSHLIVSRHRRQDVQTYGSNSIVCHTRCIYSVINLCTNGERIVFELERPSTKKTFSNRIINTLKRWYRPVFGFQLALEKNGYIVNDCAVYRQPRRIQPFGR